MDYPLPLVPFAGCDRKPVPPSPAKPFSTQASPVKASPFKERVDAATKAVLRKNWPDQLSPSPQLPADISSGQCASPKLQAVSASSRVKLPDCHQPIEDDQPSSYTAEPNAGDLAVCEHCPPVLLVPFAGCGKKPLLPNPAKPFSLPASPSKPSPFKQRVNMATDAVARKHWSPQQVAPPLKASPLKEEVHTVDAATDTRSRKDWSARQAKMGTLFGPRQ